MKKFLLGLLAVLVILGAGIWIFQEPLKEIAFKALTEDMFVTEDVDAFDPGLALGSRLPKVNAVLGDRSVSDLQQFAGPNGLVLVANRSVDW